jgi:ribonuclease HII
MKEKLVCGIDEAGRGPLIASLVMAGVLIKDKDISKLKKLGVKDSKLLTKEKREELFDKIKKVVVDYKIENVSPEEIDHNLNDPNLNLNWLEANTSAKIVNSLKPSKVIADCPSVNVAAYHNYFVNKLDLELRDNSEIIVEHKADVNYVVVGAASILAKVTRDREVEELKKKFGVDFGSGYLSDEKTQIFLRENFDKKEFGFMFRKTWKPYKDLVLKKGQRSLGDF